MQIVYRKLFSSFLRHAFIGVMYGDLIMLGMREYHLPHGLEVLIVLLCVGVVSYVAYREEVRRFYPFSKLMGAHLLAVVLLIAVALSGVYLFGATALIVVLFTIQYECKRCVTYRRFAFGNDTQEA